MVVMDPTGATLMPRVNAGFISAAETDETRDDGHILENVWRFVVLEQGIKSHHRRSLSYDHRIILPESFIRVENTHRLLSCSFLGLLCRILNMNPKQELLRSLWVFPASYVDRLSTT